jgi:hypothetical protein
MLTSQRANIVELSALDLCAKEQHVEQGRLDRQTSLIGRSETAVSGGSGRAGNGGYMDSPARLDGSSHFQNLSIMKTIIDKISYNDA